MGNSVEHSTTSTKTSTITQWWVDSNLTMEDMVIHSKWASKLSINQAKTLIIPCNYHKPNNKTHFHKVPWELQVASTWTYKSSNLLVLLKKLHLLHPKLPVQRIKELLRFRILSLQLNLHQINLTIWYKAPLPLQLHPSIQVQVHLFHRRSSKQPFPQQVIATILVLIPSSSSRITCLQLLLGQLYLMLLELLWLNWVIVIREM